jgi:hypothetical protein
MTMCSTYVSPNESLGCYVPWKMRILDTMDNVPWTAWTTRPLDDESLGLYIPDQCVPTLDRRMGVLVGTSSRVTLLNPDTQDISVMYLYVWPLLQSYLTYPIMNSVCPTEETIIRGDISFILV